MTRILKLSICTLFLLLLQNGFSQQDREKILANFDYVEYYPDSTIKEARKFSGNLEGTTVEFNTLGEPVAIGKYKKGVKSGKWIYSDGSYNFFPEQKNGPELQVDLTERYDQGGNKTGSARPGCGTGISEAVGIFYKRYFSLVDPEDKVRRSCWGM